MQSTKCSEHDQSCLQALWSIVKDYMEYSKNHAKDSELMKALRDHFDSWREQINDSELRAYYSFVQVEKLIQMQKE